MKQVNNIERLTDSDWEKIRAQRKVRLEIARPSMYWFFHIYFGHYIKHATAPFQKEMMEIASDETIDQLVIVAFRESGKSTIMTTALPLWAVMGVQQKKYVVIVSQTQTQAQQHLANIARELEHNDLIRKDFMPYEREENELGVSAINLPKFNARIIAVSREQGVRGLRFGAHRPDLIIADDVEDSRTVKTRESRNRNFAWFTGELLPLGSENTKYIVVGNLLHEDSLMMRLKDGINSGDRSGVYREYPIARNGVSLWRERFPNKASLKALERRIADRIRFEREYKLHLIPDDDQIITRGMVHYYDAIPERLRGQLTKTVVGVDLAISESDSADYTALVTVVVIGEDDDMRMYVKPHPTNKRLSFTETVDLIEAMDKTQNRPRFYVESTAYQEALVQSVRGKSIDVKGIKPTQDKRTRLNLISDKIQRGIVLFPRQGCEELLTQLTGFGIEKHDDLADALVHAVLESLRDNVTSPGIRMVKADFWGRYDPMGGGRRRKGRDYWSRRLDDWEEATSGDWD